jgi:hypothetical protein
MSTLFNKYNRIEDKASTLTSLKEFVDEVKSDKYKIIVDTLRQRGDKDKKGFPAVTFGGQFNITGGHNYQNIVQGTGLISIDIDGLSTPEEVDRVKKLLGKDKYSLITFISPSGNGVKGLFYNSKAITKEEYVRVWENIKIYLKQYNLEMDEATKDITRLCYYSYDKEIIVNRNLIDNQQPVEFMEEFEDGLTLIYFDKGFIIPYEFTENYDTTAVKVCSKWRFMGWTKEKSWIELQIINNRSNGPLEINRLKKCLESAYKKEYIDKDNIIKEKSEKKLDKFETYIPMDEIESENDVELLVDNSPINFSNIKKNCGNCKHLPMYDELVIELGYKGSNSQAIQKSIWYTVNSSLQNTYTIDVNSNVSSDNRTHSLWIAPSGSGKGLIKNFLERCCDYSLKRCSDISRLSHPEQLIGKNEKEGIGKNAIMIEVRGYLDDDILIQDEAQDILNEITPLNVETMNLLRKGMDKYGNNKITKKLTGGKVLSYHPKCRVNQFIHPVPLNNKFVDTGTMRRYCSIIELSGDRNLDIKELCSMKKGTYANGHVFSSQIQKLYYDRIVQDDPNYKFDITQECLDIISDFNGIILDLCMKSNNAGLFRYGILTKHTLKLNIVSWVSILHLTYNKKVTTPEITILACRDFLEVWLVSMETLLNGNRCRIAQSTDEWMGLEEKSVAALDYLVRKNAIDINSTVSIAKFQTVLADLYGLHIRTARGKFRDLQVKGYIMSKQTGKNSSSTWLNMVPKDYIYTTNMYIPVTLLKYLNINEWQEWMYFTGNNENDIKKGVGWQGWAGFLKPSLYYVTFLNFYLFLINKYIIATTPTLATLEESI